MTLYYPKLSIITVVYNAVTDIEVTIRSVLSKKTSAIEYIVIDGKSVDGTVDIIKKYHNKINFWLSESDCGIYEAMNKGIERSSGKWLLFLNAGDIFSKDLDISRLSFNWPSGKEFVMFPYKIIGKNSITVPKMHHFFGMPTSHQAMFTSKSIFKQQKFNQNLKVAADFELYLKRLALNKGCIYFEKIILTEVKLHGYSFHNIELLRQEYQKIIWQNLGLIKAILFFFWCRPIFFNFFKKLIPTFIFLKLKSIIALSK